MPAAEKTRPIEIEIKIGKKKAEHFAVHPSQAAEIMQIARRHAEEGFIPADEVFAEHNALNGGKAASVLRGFRQRDGLSQRELAERIGATQGDVSKMESGERSIGKEIARRLASVFMTDYRVFL